MSVSKVTISLESDLLRRVDYLVSEQLFSSRSQAIQTAIEEKVAHIDRLARECAKLDKEEEQRFADLGLKADLEEWPEY
jgi:metal-responsive CopG/Arc/MetJ family transcriptional regulator